MLSYKRALLYSVPPNSFLFLYKVFPSLLLTS
jgi:hypothetical protein